MPLKFFSVPVGDSSAAENEVNSFLARHRVVSIDRRLIEDGTSSRWAICVEYIHAGQAAAGPRDGSRARVDYKLLLTPEQFETFAKLREFRKGLAQTEGVPPYMIFTNEQLAEVVRRQVSTKAALQGIEGVGEARMEKYGPGLLDFISSIGGAQRAAGA